MIVLGIIVASIIGIVVSKKKENKEMYKSIILVTVLLYTVTVFVVSSFPSDFQKMHDHLYSEYTKNGIYSDEFLQKVQAYNNAVIFCQHFPVDTIVWGIPKISSRIGSIPLINIHSDDP
jgi:hypothetical protein